MSSWDNYEDILLSAGCYDFLQLHGRVVAEEIRRAAPEARVLYAPEAWESLATCYAHRLKHVYLGVLLYRMRGALIDYDAMQAYKMSVDDKDVWLRAARDVKRSLGEDPHAGLARDAPLLDGYVRRVRANFVDAQADLARRLASRRADIEEVLLQGESLGHVLGVSADSGDAHCHGRSVHRIVTQGGCFYYKPRPCKNDGLYLRMVNRWFADCTKAARLVTGDGYAFVEELMPSDVTSEEDVATYYRRFGTLTALFHALGSGDMHAENIMACGSYPCVIDLETLFGSDASWAHAEAKERPNPAYAVSWEYNTSVIKTAVLPFWIHMAGTFSPVVATREDEPWESMPRLEGTRRSVRGFEREFLWGFEDGYRRALEHKEAMLRMVGECGDFTLRVLLRNTLYYSFVRQSLYRKDSLDSTEARDVCLQQLVAPYAHGAKPSGGMRLSDGTQLSRTARKVVAYEAECIEEGDIPYFCARLKGTVLCGVDADDVLIDGYFVRSPYVLLREHLESLGEDDLRFELAVIRALLAHAPVYAANAEHVARESVSVGVLSEGEASDACASLLEVAWDDRVVTRSGVLTWHSGLLDMAHQGGMGLDARQQDVLWYCARMLRCGALEGLHERVRTIGGACLAATRARVDGYLRFASESGAMTDGLGIRHGMGCLVVACAQACMAGVDGAVEVLRDAVRYLSLVPSDEGSVAGRQGKLRDEAELVLALAWSSDALSGADEGHVGPARELLLSELGRWSKLVASADDTRSTQEMAFVAAALAAASHALGDTGYAKGAQRLFAQVLAAHQADSQTWPGMVGPGSWGSGSVVGADIGLLALHGARWLEGDPDALEVARLACGNVLRAGIQARDQLDGGNAASALLLVRASEALGVTGYLKDAGRILATVVRADGGRGCFACSPEDVIPFFDVCVCEGSLGVGLAIMEYVDAAMAAR